MTIMLVTHDVGDEWEHSEHTVCLAWNLDAAMEYIREYLREQEIPIAPLVHVEKEIREYPEQLVEFPEHWTMELGDSHGRLWLQAHDVKGTPVIVP